MLTKKNGSYSKETEAEIAEEMAKSKELISNFTEILDRLR